MENIKNSNVYSELENQINSLTNQTVVQSEPDQTVVQSEPDPSGRSDLTLHMTNSNQPSSSQGLLSFLFIFHLSVLTYIPFIICTMYITFNMYNICMAWIHVCILKRRRCEIWIIKPRVFHLSVSVSAFFKDLNTPFWFI